MLTLKMLRDDPKAVIEKLKIKNFDAQPIVDKVLELDALRRNLQTESDALLSQQKQKAAEIGSLMKQGLKEAAEAAKAEVAALKARSGELLARMDEASSELEKALVLMPNTPCSLVKPGKGADYLKTEVAVPQPFASLFVPIASFGGSPAIRYAGSEMTPPPPATESTKPAKNTSGQTIR